FWKALGWLQSLCRNAQPKSEVGPSTDLRPLKCDFRYAPNTGHRRVRGDVRKAPNIERPDASYSITSSARPSSGSGTLTPKALAVLRLIASSNFVACITGKSLGRSPLRIRPA